MQSESENNNTIPTADNKDLGMLDQENVGECEKRCKRPCMDIATDRETTEMAMDSCDMLGVEYIGMCVPTAPYGVIDTESDTFFMEGQDSAWQMDGIAMGLGTVADVPLDPVAPDQFHPHTVPYFAPAHQHGQDGNNNQEEEPHRPREPFAAVNYPGPMVQNDGSHSWLDDLPATLDFLASRAAAQPGPVDHEQWASPGILPMGMSSEDLIYMSQEDMDSIMDFAETSPVHMSHFGLALVTPPTSEEDDDGDIPFADVPIFSIETEEESHDQYQCPTSPPEEENEDDDGNEWDETYKGIPLETRNMSFCTLLVLNPSFADLVTMQWPEVLDMCGTQMRCGAVFAAFPTIRGLATMFNLRLASDKDDEQRQEAKQEGDDYTPAADADIEDNDVDTPRV
ncbi:hypothetical protein PGQ11_015008 [Apiospora arundinis]|uniref:Uncharacterized protein n=1 Tax=Apiospora arundinis TaxID=335852 RepID=A0ABR2HK21_9PEZI